MANETINDPRLEEGVWTTDPESGELVHLVARHLDRHAYRRASRGGERQGLDVVRGESRHVEILVPGEPAARLEALRGRP